MHNRIILAKIILDNCIVCNLFQTYIHRVMEKMIAVARQETSDYVAKQKHPHIAQLIGSYKVGKLTQDKSLCKSLFPCDGSNEHIQVNIFL